MRWTEELDAVLGEVIPGHSTQEAIDLFLERTGIELTRAQVSNRRHVLGLHSVRKPRPSLWTPERAAYFAEIVPGHEESEIRAMFLERFGIELSESQIGNAKTRMGLKSGTAGGRFRKGQQPPNKGKRQVDFMSTEGIEASKRTRFKPGEMHDRPDGWIKPLGYERVSKDGYIEVKVHDGLQVKPNKNYRAKHRVIWESLHGPIPEGCHIVFADGDKRNFDPDNLVAVPRRAWGPMNKRGAEYCNRETLEVQVALAELSRVVRLAERRNNGQ